MMWNWKQDAWPEFSWDQHRLTRAEALFAEGAGVVIGASKHLSVEERNSLTIELMSHEAVDTSAIEGEPLDRDSVQSSIRRHLGLQTDHRRASPAEAGIAEMMVDLYERSAAPLTEGVLFHWHRLITNGRTDLKDIGRYRTHVDPMQIVSGPLHAPKVHFEAPPSDEVANEMARFWQWLERSGPAGDAALPAVTRAGLAHLWFESIHPFEDGNGRVGRAVSEKILAQSLSAPAITGMASTLLKHRKAYYAELERAHRELEITDWLLWFAAKAIEAQQHTLRQVEFVLEKARLLDRVSSQLNERQERALLRLFAAGADGFLGGMSAANYMKITTAPPATATRDLAALASMGAVRRTGENKSTRYHLNIAVLPAISVKVVDIL
ncbi:Fic family protein [Brevundimonas diminuta]|uniref:Fic family protein n=1 Tax=Brevundimonas diminuta TaxID=293 RepID=UPI000207E890|nr:Fic family protein [Brevundimonas diminuta]EGF94119.1 fic/DOC family protein [Brevundimonas diminuta ATCC 11568]OWR20276.1 cell filamentation protein Fic [Brevundimonas diminuta]WQE43931.1 Fic family protein [Brevundimonas diminuta]SUW16422.1 Fic/DOC family [Brevundimonas diminuta]